MTINGHIISEDNPLLRAKESTIDKVIASEGLNLGEKRLAAISQVREMLYKSTELGEKWMSLGPTSIPNGLPLSRNRRIRVTGRITAIISHPHNPNIMYIGTAQGGVWKTIDGGKIWAPKSDNAYSLAIGALAIDPTNPDILYAGTGEGNFSGDSQYGLGLIKTTDGGENWEPKGIDKNSMIVVPEEETMGFLNCRFCRLAINSKKSTTIFAATTSASRPYILTPNVASGVYRSTDGGEHWMRMRNNLPSISTDGATDIVLNPDNSDVAYAAFWGDGVYKTINANDDNPLWTKLSLPDLTPYNCTRIALGISSSSPDMLYALAANNNLIIDKFYQTKDSGNSWDKIAINVLPTRRNGPNDLADQGAYNINIAVHPAKPDVVYLNGVSLWKAIYEASNDKWRFSNIGQDIHADNHAFAFDPIDPEVVYVGNDGGIYKSKDGGKEWDDTINQGLCITQFEFMEQHPTLDNIIFAGTQDNGTLKYHGNSEFEQVAGGDGGFVCMDPKEPNNVWHTYYRLSPEFSDRGGEESNWSPLGLFPFPDSVVSRSLFYPPLTLDKTNSNNVAIGGDVLYLDGNKGFGGWGWRIPLPKRNDLRSGEIEFISAINYVNSNLIYVGTNYGGLYRITKSNNAWTVQPIHPFLKRYIWDIVNVRNEEEKVIVIVSGFGTPHVFNVDITYSGIATWTDISGSGEGRLPDIPANAIVVDEDRSDTMYIGMDAGVFRTVDGGKIWAPLGKGLPNCQIYDMRLFYPTRLLRIVTHGRGMWQLSLDK